MAEARLAQRAETRQRLELVAPWIGPGFTPAALEAIAPDYLSPAAVKTRSDSMRTHRSR